MRVPVESGVFPAVFGLALLDTWAAPFRRPLCHPRAVRTDTGLHDALPTSSVGVVADC